jgi:putative lipoic acid-binding regulatory protein
MGAGKPERRVMPFRYQLKIGFAMHPTPPVDSLIEYPSDFPIKVMGATHEDFAATIVDVVLEHDPTFHIGRMEVRPSAKGNYTGLTVMVRATSRAQLDDLYRALSGHPMVKIVM